jgi:hypothetical protein
MSHSGKSTQLSLHKTPAETPASRVIDNSVATTNQEPTAHEVQRLLSEIDGCQVAVGSLHNQDCYTADGFSANNCTHLEKTIERYKVPDSLCLYDEQGEYTIVAPVKSWAGTERSAALIMKDFGDPEDEEGREVDAVLTVGGQRMTLGEDDGKSPWREPQRKYDQMSQKPHESREVSFRPMKIQVAGSIKAKPDRLTIQFVDI